MIDEIAFKQWLQRVVDGNGKKLAGSAIYLALFTAEFTKEPQCALELGIAIMLDKPIYIVASNGTSIPENIRRLARGIEFFDSGDKSSIAAATAKIVKKFGAH